MSKFRLLPVAAFLLAFTIAACEDSSTAPAAERFSATLSGANEVPTAVTTTATGSVAFTAIGDTAISYTVTVNGITGVTMGHIHAAAAGVNGGVVAWLLPPNGTAAQAPSGALSGSVATGRINASWIRTLSGATGPMSLDSLKSLMRTGRVYVNIHTSANGGGELRGQINLN